MSATDSPFALIAGPCRQVHYIFLKISLKKYKIKTSGCQKIALGTRQQRIVQTGKKRMSDALRAQRGASRQLNLIFHSVPIHPRYKAGLSRHIPVNVYLFLFFCHIYLQHYQYVIFWSSSC
jgi:hypothetical protein